MVGARLPQRTSDYFAIKDSMDNWISELETNEDKININGSAGIHNSRISFRDKSVIVDKIHLIFNSRKVGYCSN